jgi:T5SS/PEP-CTERM-associated repeat protein
VSFSFVKNCKFDQANIFWNRCNDLFVSRHWVFNKFTASLPLTHRTSSRDIQMKRSFLKSLLIVAASVASAFGQDTFFWANASGGSYHTAGNWAPLGGPPIFDDFARFNLNNTYTVTFANAGTQTIDFQVSNGNVTFASLNSNAQHFWGNSSTNDVGPAAGDANSSATLNLTNMFNLPMRGNHLVVGRAAGKTGTLNIHSNGNWESWSGGNLTLGQSGTGNLNISTVGISQKSSLKSHNVIMGTGGGTGNAAVSGLNASLTATNNMIIGDSTNSLGSLTISNQGKANVSSLLRIGSAGTGTLNVNSGGHLTADRFEIGSSATGVGTLSIVGAGSLVDVSGLSSSTIGLNGSGTVNLDSGGVLSTNSMLYLGSNGIGTLNVKGGSQVYSSSGDIGSGVAGSSATVEGANSLWSMTGDMAVGWSSSATLNILDGGHVNSQAGRLGVVAGSIGTVNISGPGSLWNNAISGVSPFRVGQSGHGVLNITNGGGMISNFVVLASEANSQANAKIEGSGSFWNINDGIRVGDVGNGSLSVINGGKLNLVNNAFMSIGDSTGSSGSLIVSGPDSAVTGGPISSIGVGYSGTGALDVRLGGKMDVGYLSLGTAMQGSGSAIVRNADSQLNVGERLTVGFSGNGTFAIDNGSQATAKNMLVGANYQSNGTVVLSGLGSSLDISQVMSVGGNLIQEGGSGSLVIHPGTTVSVGDELRIHSQGIVNLNGGTLKLANLVNGGQFNWNQGTVQFTQSKTLDNGFLNSVIGSSHTLGNGQFLEGTSGTTLSVGSTNFAVDGGQLNGTNLSNTGTTAVNKGSINMTGQFVNEANGIFVLQNLGQSTFDGGVTNLGTFQLGSLATKSSGGAFTNNGIVSGRGQLHHQLINNGVIEVGFGDHLTNANGSNLSINQNLIQLAGGRLDFTGVLDNAANGVITGRGVLGTSMANLGGQGLHNNGIFAVSGGSMDIYGDVRNTSAGRIVTSGNSTTTFWDDVEHNGAEIRTALGSSTVFYGEVSGAGPFNGIGAVFFEGDLKPGNSPANVLFEGDVHFGSTASLGIEIGGLFAGSEHDRLTIHGDIWLNGSLDVSLINGYTPNFGDYFLVIQNRGTNPLHGQFTGLDQGSIVWAGSQQFAIDYFGGSGRDLVLTAVPEPSTMFLLGLVSARLLLTRRRNLV